eukprot:gene2761-4169_t
MDSIKEFITERPFLSVGLVSLTAGLNAFAGYTLYKKISVPQYSFSPLEHIIHMITLGNYRKAEELMEEFKKNDKNGILSLYLDSYLYHFKNDEPSQEMCKRITEQEPKTMEEKIVVSFAHQSLKQEKLGHAIVEEIIKTEEKPISMTYFAISRYIDKEFTNKEKSLEYLLRSVEMGNVFAEYEYGLILVEGKFGIEKNVEKGMKHLRNSSNAGYLCSTYKLANIYEYGINGVIKPDLFMAYVHYKKAAVHSPRAMADCAFFNSNGMGTKLNIPLALEYYNKAYYYGYTTALVQLGLLYEVGEKVERDINKALEYYSKALEEKCYVACDSIAYIYSEGVPGVEKDLKKAVEYAQIGAQHRNPGSYYFLGRSFQFGFGCQVNLLTAYKYYRLSADLGNKIGCYQVGAFLEEGISQPEDPDEPLRYFLKSHDLGYQLACIPIGFCYFNKNDLKNAYHYFKLSHMAGEAEGTYWYGRIVELGFEGFQPNAQLAFSLYLESFKNGFQTADISLGYYFLNGLHGPADYHQSFHYYQLAANRGSPQGYTWVGYHFSHGLGVEKNPILAFQYFKSAYQLGDRKDACLYIGLALLLGIGVQKDETESLKFFLEGSDNGSKDCMYNAGVSYEKGDGCEIDLQKALHYYKLAEKYGHPKSSSACSILPFLMNKWVPDEDAKQYSTQEIKN